MTPEQVAALRGSMPPRRTAHPALVWILLAAFVVLFWTAAWYLVPVAITQGGVGMLLILAAVATIAWAATLP